MTDETGDKKTGDLTSLNEFATTLNSEAPVLLEGMDDPLVPMAPGEGDQTEDFLLDPIANLPPIDGDTLAAAAGEDELAALTPDLSAEAGELLADPTAPYFSAPPLPDTPVGAAIAGALSASPLSSEVADDHSMGAVKNYSDHVAPAGPESAETPFSLSIEGPLREHERETLIGILARENLGIREVELEPQFAAGRVLIPRISEYAGVLIVQALRNSTAKMRLGPSERIFKSKDPDHEERLIYPPNPDAELFIHEDGTDRAETVLLTSADSVPGRKLLAAIDTLHTSMNLKSINLAQPQSPLFQDAIERLKKQLKFQAHHRGANALVGFKYTLHTMEGQTMHKLVVEARAVRVETEA